VSKTTAFVHDIKRKISFVSK